MSRKRKCFDLSDLRNHSCHVILITRTITDRDYFATNNNHMWTHFESDSNFSKEKHKFSANFTLCFIHAPQKKSLEILLRRRNHRELWVFECLVDLWMLHEGKELSASALSTSHLEALYTRGLSTFGQTIFTCENCFSTWCFLMGM